MDHIKQTWIYARCRSVSLRQFLASLVLAAVGAVFILGVGEAFGYIVGGIFLLAGFSLAWQGLSRWISPGTHPVVKRMAAWGDPISVAGQIDQELRLATRLKVGSARLTEHFLVRSGLLFFELFRWQDMIWAYKRVTKHSVNFIPTGKTYEVVFTFPDAQTQASGREKRVEEMLKFAAERTPWAAFGFSQAMEEAWRDDPRTFVEAVAQRRLQWSGSHGSSANRPLDSVAVAEPEPTPVSS